MKKRFLTAYILIFICSFILCGCNSDPGGVFEDFEKVDLRGWKLSDDASYGLSTEEGFSGVLLKNGGRYFSSGEIRSAYNLENSSLHVSRYFSAMETEEYLRGIFFTSQSMTMGEAETASVDIEVINGCVSGISFGTDNSLHNGFAAIINLAKNRVEVMRVNDGILTSLDNYQPDCCSKSVNVEEGQKYRLTVQYRNIGNNTHYIKVWVGNTEVIDTTIANQGIELGRGNRLALVASDMNCIFSKFKLSSSGEIPLNDSDIEVYPSVPKIIDDKFTGKLTSKPFKIRSDYITLKVGGTESSEDVNVNLIDYKSGEILFSETGTGSEEMTRRVWDVKDIKGRKCVISISDNTTAGHINVDQIRLTDKIPSDSLYSILNSQVGYGLELMKKAYLRSPIIDTESVQNFKFTLNNADSGEIIYEGETREIGNFWNSKWWEMDFSDCRSSGRHVITVKIPDSEIVSCSFLIDDDVLSKNALIDASLTQLDLRRSPNKLGWRDSSTDELREVHTQAMVVHTMADMLEMLGDSLNEYDKARVIDNIRFGVDYLIAAQEITDNPKTSGRFKHDIYPSQFTAHDLRSWSDTVYCMTALARSYPYFQNSDKQYADKIKATFDISFDMCTLRPYYLMEEFNIHDENGYHNVQSAIKLFYYLREMNWQLTTDLRTRDRLIFMHACTLMAQNSNDMKYAQEARKLGKLISARQHTDYKNTIDGAYGFFYEFDNSDEAIMLEWIQGYNILLGNQTPTNLQPFIDLLQMFPDDSDAAMWYNTVKIYTDGYVRKTAKLTPLGIYPVAAYKDTKYGGIKFFQTLSHGASSHYGFSARNIMQLAQFFGDPQLQKLALNNVQFIVGLNPGFPETNDNTSWKSYSLLYLIGSRYFEGSFNNTSYKPPIGSGFNGFSASDQFNPQSIAVKEDMPNGILNSSNTYQFNEDYLPVGIGFSAGAAATEADVCVPIKTFSDGVPVSAKVEVVSESNDKKQYSIDNTGELVIKELNVNSEYDVIMTYEGITRTKKITTISGNNKPIVVDFKTNIDIQISVPQIVKDPENGSITLNNISDGNVNIQIKLLADGVDVDGFADNTFTLCGRESRTITFNIKPQKICKPYLVYAYIEINNVPHIITASGFSE